MEYVSEGMILKRKRSKSVEVNVGSGDNASCPYLDSVQRRLLDFDFEPACSISMETGPHIYCCLVCGKFFRGKGPSTAAFSHSVEETHFVFVHLQSGKFHCLPDGYEVHDPSLQDIKAALDPTFTAEQIAVIDTQSNLSRDLFGRRYLPGFVGLNNLKKTDCINSVIQALAHVPPLRDFFLLRRDDQSLNSNNNCSPKRLDAVKSSLMSQHHLSAHSVTKAFGDLVRKIWSPHRFKSSVDPHLMIQAISTASSKRFQVGQQAEAGELMRWLLHQLHLGTGGGKKAGSSIVHELFQGEVTVITRQAKRVRSNEVNNRIDDTDDRGGSDVEDHDRKKNIRTTEPGDFEVSVEDCVLDTHFLQLTLEIPEKPLFRDEDGGLVIPQEPYVNVLKKFDGVTFSDALTRSGVALRKKYQIKRLPNYLILHLARFKTNKYSREKNPAIVAFPITNFDLSDYVGGDIVDKETPPTADRIQGMSVKEIKALLKRFNHADLANASVEKQDLVDSAIDFVTRSLPDLLQAKYALCANITHLSKFEVGREGSIDPLQMGSYMCHVQHRGTQQWYEIQDLHVQKIMTQQIGLTESILLIFERKFSQFP